MKAKGFDHHHHEQTASAAASSTPEQPPVVIMKSPSMTSTASGGGGDDASQRSTFTAEPLKAGSASVPASPASHSAYSDDERSCEPAMTPSPYMHHAQDSFDGASVCSFDSIKTTSRDSVYSKPPRPCSSSVSTASSTDESTLFLLMQNERSSVVQFDLYSTSYHENPLADDEEEYDVKSRWYDAGDYKKFKSQVIQIVKAVLKAQRRREKSQEGASGGGSDDSEPFSYSNVLEGTYNACFQMELEIAKMNILTKDETKTLLRLYRTSLDTECVLGLERLLVQRIGKDRSELRASLFGIICDLQDTPWPHFDVLAENIFKISQEVSRPARLFARHLAIAQAMSVQQQNSSSHGGSSSRRNKNNSNPKSPRHKAAPSRTRSHEEVPPQAPNLSHTGTASPPRRGSTSSL